MRQPLVFLALTVVFIAGCSTVAPNADGLDGPTTTIAIATGADDFSTLGVPFADGQPVVETVSVAITATDDPQNPIDLRFSFADGLYSYDPAGLVTTIGFDFQGTVNVALPAGHDYGFESTGADSDKTWLAYGITTTHVDATTTTVRLALQTMIDSVTLEATTPTTAVDPGQTIDLHLTVRAPGGYIAPVADYTVTYAILPADGTIGATSKVGSRAVATASPVGDTFTLTATVAGRRDVAGVATMSDLTTTFAAPYAITSGISLDTTAPVVTIDATIDPVYVGTAHVLGGTATDDTGIDRLQIYEGPVLIGSTEPLEHEADGVEPIALLSGDWTVDWTPTEARSHTLTAIGIDAAGNDHRASTTIEVGEALTTLTFVDGEFGTPATLTAGESLILEGTAFIGFDSIWMEIYLSGANMSGVVSTAGLVIADGMWTLDWTAPVAGSYNLYYDYYDPDAVIMESAYFSLTIQ